MVQQMTRPVAISGDCRPGSDWKDLPERPSPGRSGISARKLEIDPEGANHVMPGGAGRDCGEWEDSFILRPKPDPPRLDVTTEPAAREGDMNPMPPSLSNRA
jgi:hypothetical protein